MGVKKLPKSMVFVEIEGDKILRIVKNKIDVWELPPERVQQWCKSEAVKKIRDQVFERSGGECEFCGKKINKATGHLHETLARGKRDKDGKYGEISMDNSVFICYSCHILGEHGDRVWGGRQGRLV